MTLRAAALGCAFILAANTVRAQDDPLARPVSLRIADATIERVARRVLRRRGAQKALPPPALPPPEEP